MNLPDLPLRLSLTLASKASQDFVTRPKRQCALSGRHKVNVSSVSFDAMAAFHLLSSENRTDLLMKSRSAPPHLHAEHNELTALKGSVKLAEKGERHHQATLTHPA
jgi:hypothetical protein